MAANISNYLENKIINITLRATAWSAPATVYAALFTTDPAEDASGTEVSGGSYARTAITFGAPSDGVSTNSADCTFPTATDVWGTVTHCAIYDASTAGNQLYQGSLTASKSIASGDIFKFVAGDFSIQIT